MKFPDLLYTRKGRGLGITAAVPRPSGTKSAWIVHRRWLMAIEWETDVDAGIAEAKASGKHALLDFSAAPM
ncbi:MAG TPA: hypothetical protein VH854_09650 [Thermoanaerobaculia bacterium]|nr:hypothetical protein [Thermoanaerobaculia bacterium]